MATPQDDPADGPLWGWRHRLTLGLGLGAAVAAPLSNARWTWWLAAAAAGLISWTVYFWWYESRGPGAVIRGLVSTWSALHGARVQPDGIDIFDQRQPIRVRFGGHGRSPLIATICTRLVDTPVAFRIWPADQTAPAFERSEIPSVAHEMERAAEVEARVAGVMRIESNAPDQAARIIDSALLQAAIGAKKAAGGSFEGITWDGRFLRVHWRGGLVADPERTLALSRPVWLAVLGQD